MEGFDDLLAPSRNVLEENPFEDPFAKRSSSPDPWSSSFLHQPAERSTHNDIDYYKTGFEDVPERSTSPTPTTESYVTGDRGYSDQNSTVDPLDAAVVTAEDRDDEHNTAPTDAISPRRPGFRVSTYSVEEHTTTVPDVNSGSPAGDDERLVRDTTSPHQDLLVSPSSPATFSPAEDTTLPYSSKSEQSFPPAVDQSFASTTFGGDSQRGWQSNWGTNDRLSPVHLNTTAEDEDDDDDKPIGQSAKFKGLDRINSQVSTRMRVMNQLHAIQQVATSPGPIVKSNDPSAPVFVISVDDPQRVGDPIRSFTMYTVHTRVSRFCSRRWQNHLHSFPDDLSAVPKVSILRATSIFRLPMAIRNSFNEQSGRRCPPCTRKKFLWTFR